MDNSATAPYFLNFSHSLDQLQQLLRAGKDVFDGVVHGDTRVVQHQHSVGVLGDILHAVGHQQHGGAGLFVVLLHLGKDIVPSLAVKTLLEAQRRRDAGESLVLPRSPARKGGAV